MWTRRSLLWSIAGSAVWVTTGCGPKKGVGAADNKLQKRFDQFAVVVAEQRWDDALAFFDTEHFQGQRGLYFDDADSDPGNPAHVLAFREWYLVESMGLARSPGPRERLADIRSIGFGAITEPFGADGPLEVKTRIAVNNEVREGWFFIDRVTYAFSSASG